MTIMMTVTMVTITYHRTSNILLTSPLSFYSSFLHLDTVDIHEYESLLYLRG